MDKIQEQLGSILETVDKWAKTSEGFVVEQAPAYVQELLLWGFWGSLIPFILAVIGIVNLAFAIPFTIKKDNKAEITFPIAAYFFLSLFIGFVSIVCLPDLFEWVQILIAPKAWLVEYISHHV